MNRIWTKNKKIFLNYARNKNTANSEQNQIAIRPKVVLGMSGGVDSSVALFLLKKQGFEVVGATLKFGFWESAKNKARENVCCSCESIQRAKKVCQKYGAPYFVLDCSKVFKKTVMDYFLETLQQQKTPSPCLFCNRDVKMRALIAFARKKKADYVATGHYARIGKSGKTFCLWQAKDKTKDQSYFLAFLSQGQLSKLIFPLGNYTKKQVYKMAGIEGIDFAQKQSQDLCFVADRSLPLFLEEKIGFKPGKICDTRGRILGKHQGLHFYTIGQRKGIKLSGGPFWVVGFDEKKNFLIVTNNPKDPVLFAKEVFLSQVNFVSGKLPKKRLRIEAKTRFKQSLSKALVFVYDKNQAKLIFDKPQRAVTPGQTAVFYQKEICLGGGTIKATKQ